MIAVSRFRVPEDEQEPFLADLTEAHRLLAARPGYVDGQVGRNLDDPELWTLVTRWVGVGAYRRALSAPEVKLGAVRLLGRALDEPGAYEVVDPARGLDGLDRTRS